MAHDPRPFRERYAEAAGALRRRQAARLVLLFVVFVLFAIVARALTAPSPDAASNRSDPCPHNLAPCSTPR